MAASGRGRNGCEASAGSTPDPPSPDEVGESDVDEEPPEASLVEPEMDV